MSKRVELTCPCGASAVFIDELGAYINYGAIPDLKGRKFLIEVRADEWLDRHQACVAARLTPSG